MWYDGGSHTLGDNSAAVHGQIFNADGSKAGAEFLVNTTTARTSIFPRRHGARRIVRLRPRDIYAQVFGADGSKVGAEIWVKAAAGIQVEPDIATLVDEVNGADAGFVITWADSTGDGLDIRAQRYDANGSKVGSDFLVNTATALHQEDPAVAGLTNGRFVVAWESSSGGTDTVRLQIFNADGSKFGTEFGATAFVIANQDDPSITALAGGRFIVTWTNEYNGEINSYGQIFNANGTRGAGTSCRTRLRTGPARRTSPRSRTAASWRRGRRTMARAITASSVSCSMRTRPSRVANSSYPPRWRAIRRRQV